MENRNTAFPPPLKRHTATLRAVLEESVPFCKLFFLFLPRYNTDNLPEKQEGKKNEMSHKAGKTNAVVDFFPKFLKIQRGGDIYFFQGIK